MRHHVLFFIARKESKIFVISLSAFHILSKGVKDMQREKSILQLFPGALRPYFEKTAVAYEDLSEIRIRAGRPVLVHRRGSEYYVAKDGTEKLAKGNCFCDAVCLDVRQVDQIFVHLCQHSPYAYSEALKQGFLTVAGGHRIGVAGQIVRSAEGIAGIRNIRFLNIRISHEIKNVAVPYIPYLYEEGTERIHNCLIIAPPGMGKTTMLRDIVRLVSDGSDEKKGCSVAVVDERSEIAGCFQGEPQNDVGLRTDVLDACPKAFGMEMMLRSMSPEVLAVDEIAMKEDVETLLLLLHCGVRVLATVHGESYAQMKEKEYLKPLLGAEYFKRFLILSGKDKIRLYDEKGECLL